jgi:ataxin-3
MELSYMSAGNQNGVASKDFLRRVAEGSANVDDSGNFSIEVLRSALLRQFNLTLVNTLQENVRNLEITNFDGFICNKQSHWFAIRKINGRFWNLNSMIERPEQISHFKLAAEVEALRREGYSVFCVAEIGSLPAECKDERELTSGRGQKEFWWKESDLIAGTGSRGYSNPWSNVGNGMRLDGKPTTARNSADHEGSYTVEGLSEEEMLQMAMSASLQPETQSHFLQSQSRPSLDVDYDKMDVPPEPEVGTNGAVRIQFRFPDGKRITRRFLKSDSVKILFAFVHRQLWNEGSGRILELKVGFPPTKDLSLLCDLTIEGANLSGESIQCRYS